MAKLENLLLPGTLLEENVSFHAKVIAGAILAGYRNQANVAELLGIGRSTVYENWSKAQELAAKYLDSLPTIAEDCVRQLSGNCPPAGRIVRQLSASRTEREKNDVQYAEHEIFRLQDTVDKLLKQLNKASELNKSVDEKLALEVLTLNINVPTEPKEKDKRGGKNFVAPTFDEVLAAFKELKPGLSELTLVYNADRFFNHYSLVNWAYGKTKTPLKKWRMAVGQWRIDDVPPNEISIYKAKLPKPPAPEPEPEFDPYKNLIPEVDHPLFAQLPEKLKQLAYEANARFFVYEEETGVAVKEMLKNMKRTDAITELRIKHQWQKMDQVRWWVKEGIYELQKNLLQA